MFRLGSNATMSGNAQPPSQESLFVPLIKSNLPGYGGQQEPGKPPPTNPDPLKSAGLDSMAASQTADSCRVLGRVIGSYFCIFQPQPGGLAVPLVAKTQSRLLCSWLEFHLRSGSREAR